MFADAEGCLQLCIEQLHSQTAVLAEDADPRAKLAADAQFATKLLMASNNLAVVKSVSFGIP